MAGERILIVEDEGIVAADLQVTLQRIGYQVVGTAASGPEAIEIARAQKPDLVLMDIRIKGDMDGVQTAEALAAEMNVPISYLTAYADESTLERAKTTLPYGYILKPFQERDLRTTIEVALYRHRLKHLLDAIDGWSGQVLQQAGAGVMTLDDQGRITFLNPLAEKWLGVTLPEVFGKPHQQYLKGTDAALNTNGAVNHPTLRSAVLVSGEPKDQACWFTVRPLAAAEGSNLPGGHVIVFFPAPKS